VAQLSLTIVAAPGAIAARPQSIGISRGINAASSGLSP
jgi:hypothetical protein